MNVQVRGVSSGDFKKAEATEWNLPMGKGSECKFEPSECKDEHTIVRIFSMSTAPNAIGDMGQNFKNIHYIVQAMKKVGIAVQGLGHIIGCGGKVNA